ncbi:MAG: tetratricopeptide repeat protein, partial [Acidobacteria bacterium]|nr:tetratricopeptide repeat protein [Acidobacteriota bacterium]
MPEWIGRFANVNRVTTQGKPPVASFRFISLLILLASNSSSRFEEHLKLGQYYLEQNASGRAVTEFEEAVRLEPNRADAHYNLGVALRQWGDLSGAEVSLRRACELQPRFPEAHFALGLVLGDRIGSERLGLAEFEKALAQRPDYPESHFNIGMIYWKEDALDQAVESFRKAVAARPDSPQFRTRLGQAFIKKQQLAEAIQELSKAVELDPTSRDAFYQLAVAQARSGDAKASANTMAVVERLLDQGKRSVQRDQSYLLYTEGMTALDRGQASVAIQKLSQALPKPHNEVLVRTALGVAYQLDGNL